MGARPSKGRQATPVTSSPPSNGPDFWPVSSSSSPWTDLQPDLADLILRRLTSHADRVRFAAVCRHWRYVAREYSLPRLPPALPWVSFRGGPFETLILKDGDVGERHFIGTKEEAVCHGSFGNWQLFKEQQAGSGIWRSRHSRYLRNPLSGATVRLPGHCDKPVCLNGDDSYGKWFIRKSTDFDISKVIVCSDDLVAAIVLYHHLHMGTQQVVMCCRPGMSSWSRGLCNINHWYIDMAFYKGKLYTVTREGRLFAHEVGKSGRSAKGKPRVHQIQQVSLAAPSSLDEFFTSSFFDMSCYLVTSHTGKLWMVRWVLPYGNKGEVVVKVFEADLETSQWLEVKRLGDQVLFLSPNCSKAISTSGHSGYPKGNIIYFLDYGLNRLCLPNKNYRTCLYYMGSKKFVPISVGQNINYSWEASWFFP
ncbi:unnamed protein product [Urochloa decumbens]|uniref:KIB1-4 beta-propeller domain-containing protein n=1 Tax=Urochloa decumbens TaxID=240449 RepID=A0ABC9AIK9_9POAL